MKTLLSILAFSLWASLLWAQSSLRLDVYNGTSFGEVSVPLGNNSLLGFGATGTPTRLTLGTGLTLSGTTLNAAGGAWSDITGKPTTFPPESHNQAWSTITSTPSTLAGYGISDSLTAAAAAAAYAPISHMHDISQISYLQDLLDQKAPLQDPNFLGSISVDNVPLGAAAFASIGPNEYQLLQWASSGNTQGPTSVVTATALGAIKRTSALPINLGGTGATSANQAVNNVLPSQSAQAGKYLRTDGANVSWGPLAFPSIITGSNSLQLTDGNLRYSELTHSQLTFNDADSGMGVQIDTPNISSTVLLTWPSQSGVLLTDSSNLAAAKLTGTIASARLPTTITGLTSVTSTSFIGALTGVASGNLPLTGGTLTGALTLPNAIVSGLSLTGTQATNTLNLSTTWNTTGNPTFIYGRVTNTASGSTAYLVDLGTTAGGSLFRVGKTGILEVPSLNLNGWTLIGGASGNVGLTLGGNQTIAIGGGAAGSGGDIFLGRGGAAATFQLGINHATTATAQTIKAHDVTTGTGANLVLSGGTGSVASGRIVLNSDLQQTTATRTVRFVLSGTQSFSHSDFVYQNGGIFRIAETSIAGTNDVFFQGFPATTAGFTILESWAGAGLILATGNAATPISFRTNRVERMRFYGSGGLFIGATPFDPGANNLAVQGSTIIGTSGTASSLIKHGTATLTAGTVTVSDSNITATSRIFVNRQTDGGTIGDSYSITRTAGVSFTITSKTANSTVTGDTSTVSYLIINP